MIDYEYMALSLANLSSIPVRLYRNGKFAGLFHNRKFKPDLAILEEPNIFKNKASVSYYMTEEFLIYGLFRAKEDVAMVLGPIAQLSVDRARAGRILLSIGESPARTQELQNYLRSIPTYPLRNFLQILCTFSYFLNGEKLSIADILTDGIEMHQEEIILPPAEPEEDPPAGHNTYDLEQILLSYIEHGRPDALERLFQMPATGRAGTIAHDTLRQQKNLLIVIATLSSRAAIRGGMDPETAFGLSDLYIQKAELMNSYEALTKLYAQVTMDYAKIVADLQCGEHGRKLIRSARQYILEHIHTRITTEELAQALGRNRSYLCACFKEETGMTVNDYITQIKMDEAKRLLRYSQKPLRAVAEQLGYSTQSYFQNVFKKVIGMTPLDYRMNSEI